ncbi:hypothetical protein BC567DRAFT_213013 [Phyllosticta citribraziliensis]
MHHGRQVTGPSTKTLARSFQKRSPFALIAVVVFLGDLLRSNRKVNCNRAVSHRIPSPLSHRAATILVTAVARETMGHAAPAIDELWGIAHTENETDRKFNNHRLDEIPWWEWHDGDDLGGETPCSRSAMILSTPSGGSLMTAEAPESV